MHEQNVDRVEDDPHCVSCILDLLDICNVLLLDTVDSFFCLVQEGQGSRQLLLGLSFLYLYFISLRHAGLGSFIDLFALFVCLFVFHIELLQ